MIEFTATKPVAWVRQWVGDRCKAYARRRMHACCVRACSGFGLVWVLCVVVCPVWLSGVVCAVVWAKGNSLQNGNSIGIHGIHARGARVCAESLQSRPPLCTLEDNKSAKGVECSWLLREFTLHVTWTQSGVYDGSASEHELSRGDCARVWWWGGRIPQGLLLLLDRDTYTPMAEWRHISYNNWVARGSAVSC